MRVRKGDDGAAGYPAFLAGAANAVLILDPGYLGWEDHRNVYGKSPCLLLQLVLEYAGGGVPPKFRTAALCGPVDASVGTRTPVITKSVGAWNQNPLVPLLEL